MISASTSHKGLSHMGPQTEAADQLHAMKYREERESFRDAVNRISNALSDDPTHYHQLREIIGDMRFSPAGRVQAGAGSKKHVTAHNCLAGNVKILTREFGAIEIEKVAGQKVTLLDGNHSWIKSEIFAHGEQETVELTFKGGFETIVLRSTLEHGWVNHNQKNVVLTKALNRRCRFEIEDLRPSKDILDEQIYLKGVIHGLIYGDGAKTTKGAFQIRICSNHTDLEPILIDFPRSTPPSSNGDPTYFIAKSKAWCDLKRLPTNPGESLDYLLGFIRGWFGADGCVSTQPEATICGDKSEMDWLATWGPLVSWHVRGFTALSAETNFGPRKKKSLNIRLKKSSMIEDDFLLKKHRERWLNGNVSPEVELIWRAHGPFSEKRIEKVYCPLVPTTHSFALPSGIHSRNCFVAANIADSMVDGPNCIMDVAKDAAATMRMGGGIGYDFSTLRPRRAPIVKLKSLASGPVEIMEIFNSICKMIASAGHRRGAQMGVMRVDHPDIVEFINAKHDNTTLTGFNVSVAVTDEFMEALYRKGIFQLKFNGQVHGEIDAEELWQMIMRSTYDYAEPGVLFIDQINRMNNLWYCETISATNPCGEQPLPPHGACLLGSINLTKYLLRRPIHVAMIGAQGYIYPQWELNIEQIETDMPVIVRAMDNVIDRSNYPLQAQKDEAINKRRMGLGVMGLANALEALGLPYGTPGFLDKQSEILFRINNAAYKASAMLAKEKGAFPLYDSQKYAMSNFIRSDAISEETRDLISLYGIRNSHLTSIAPTGTISMAADNISSGLEPVFSYKIPRPINTPDGQVVVDVEDYGVKFLGVKGRTSDDVKVEEHVAVLTTAQRYVDSAVSKTCNVPTDISWDAFNNVYLDAYKGKAKGITTFRMGGKRFALLTAKSDNEPEASCKIDLVTGRRECA